ncbi:MAG: hypothetical protein CGU29_01750 [Candidatus Dactylopiibacterium carminicum]|uniref:DUF2892 domain-containing protein n=1 Tax=Candidatus Dactylopiibacterium carminicum TaxID=857335 RepID=A0A272EYK1_9RHOO|nr:DUF2892 domain-containing protein [Candidatus Dactylopiibacterium carminicum]KAF7600571.1 DUF2892 domain-containing protein [Candidatus Dactylopiibacterium carminicum]PAS95193.1 MAG: hypothetical protein CGU29_01750 [Candidatus Dactylopiibacterium carminicum]PAT00576.1 MAG: hypothetical protein BSR46_01435 [Candidatus Dactylopiibacterium carminicum]
MKRNVGGVDRALRVTIGLALVILAAMGIIGAWGWIGLLPIATGLASFCPLYSMIGIDTCPPPPKKSLEFRENLPESFHNEVSHGS